VIKRLSTQRMRHSSFRARPDSGEHYCDCDDGQDCRQGNCS
jgi:hypothetical protein